MNLSLRRSRSASCAVRFPWMGWASLLLIGLLQPARAQNGASILPADLYDFRGSVGANATAEPIAVGGQLFTQGYRITVNRTSRNIQDASLSWRSVGQINPGDNLQLTFWVRKIAPLDGHNIRGFVGLEKAAAPVTRQLFTPFPCDSDAWTKYILPFKSSAAYSAGEARVFFQFAHGPQTFEIGGISAVNFGPTPPLSATATPVLADDVYQSSFSYVDSKVGGSVSPITIADQSFTQGYRIVHFGDSDFVYRSGLGWKNARAIARNDLLQLTFWARKLEPVGTAIIRAQIVFERASGNFEKSINTNLPNDTTEWKLFQLPFRASADFGPNEAQLVFQFAYGPQSFEVGGISLVNYGQNTRPEQLQSSYYYPARGDLNAAWRIAAENRINRLRKGNLSVRVVDRDGRPVPQATVHVQQADHAFKFGSAVTAARLMGTGVDNEIYRSRVSSHFTTTVFENDLKWGPWECTNCGASFNKAQTRAALAWLADRGLAVRGHNLIWPSWNFMPADTRDLGPDALRSRIESRFNEVAADAGINGRLYQWDVINEPYTSYDVMGLIGGVPGIDSIRGVLPPEEMIQWFQMARRIDPKAVLFVNDYEILAAGGQNVRHQNYLFGLSQWLLDNGAPVGGVGLQGHFDRVTPPELLQTIIERFSQLPVALAVTEYDFNILDEELQAEYTREVLTMIFSQPKFSDFLMWGFWERSHWLPSGAMYRADWSSKPMALAWNDLLFREWWTNESGATDRAGRFAMRGFKGTYSVTAEYGRISQTTTATVDNQSELTITLDTTLPRTPIRRGDGRILQ
ncbi:MAG: endo-1,4-beta-xylanase [Blastocatellia bacterium]|nr:endo-1,4-beta-xylanase [Blastocatellia bacterium]